MKKRAKINKGFFLIFDFDGTIADTKQLYYLGIYNELKKYGFNHNQVNKIINLGLSLEETLKKFGFSFIVLWILKMKIMKNVKKNIRDVKKCRDVEEIKKIKERKIIVSNSLKEFVVPIITHFKLNKYFEGIYGAEDFNDKAEFIKEYLKKNRIKKDRCYYIGDRAADIRVARKVGCKGIIIMSKCAWNSRKEILDENPEIIVSDIAEIKDVLK